MTFDDLHPLAGFMEPLPEDGPVDDPEPEADGAPETGSARTARERRDAAQRKRDERARRKAEGMPDPRVVDSAVATAIAAISRRARFRQRAKAQSSFQGLHLGLEAILGQAIQELVEHRGVAMPQARAAIKARLGLTRQA